jgi:hypothetical protein
VSAPKGKAITITAKKRQEIAAKYSDCLNPPAPKIASTILDVTDFDGARAYIRQMVNQINGSYQFHFFDSCAVMMRRLVEVLIIDAYDARGEDARIRGADNNLLMLNGLINALNSGQTFKLSRNAPSYLESLKLLGDTAAHSRNYITKKKDIDDFAQKFRMLVEELRHLA